MMKVNIVSPEKTLYKGETDSVMLPGEMGRLEVLQNHAPIISTLTAGEIVCRGSEDFRIEIKTGFVEVEHNVVSICVETA